MPPSSRMRRLTYLPWYWVTLNKRRYLYCKSLGKVLEYNSQNTAWASSCLTKEIVEEPE
jgi:hypothetical protein